MQAFEKFMQLIHNGTFCVYWLFYLGYIFILIHLASNKDESGKIVQLLQMLGAAALIAGIFYPPLTIIPFIWLLPISIIEIVNTKKAQFYNNLYCCVIPLLLLVMNRSYGLI